MTVSVWANKGLRVNQKRASYQTDRHLVALQRPGSLELFCAEFIQEMRIPVVLCAAVLAAAQDYGGYQEREDAEEDGSRLPPQNGYGGGQQEGGYGGGGGYMSQQQAPCQCFRCDGEGIAEGRANCLGPSEACSVDSAAGCFGQ